jgi:type IV pilus assembly protein PilC
LFSTNALIREKATLFRQLATMVSAGLTISEALSTLQTRTQDARLRAFLVSAAKAVMAGDKLSDEVARHPDLFPPLTHAMIEVAEESGRLDELFDRLAGYHERDYQIRQMISRETLYPKVLALAILFIPLGGNVMARWLTVGFLSAFLLFFEVLLLYALFLGLPAFLLWRAYVTLSQTEAGRDRIDLFKLRIPVIGKIVLRSSLARFSRALAALYACGLPMDRSLRLAGGAAANAHIRGIAETAAWHVKDGESVTVALVNAGLTDDLVLSMVRTGEQTGNLDDTVDHVADYYESETETAIRQLTVIAGVACILIAAIVVGVIVIRFYTGLLSNMPVE